MKLNEVIKQYDNPESFLSEVKRRLIEIGEEKPDFVYNTFGCTVGCKYDGPAKKKNFDFKSRETTEESGPDCKGCIFGTVLQDMGWDNKKEMDFGGSICDLLHRDEIHCPTIFCEIQSLQDEGVSWGQAVKCLK